MAAELDSGQETDYYVVSTDTVPAPARRLALSWHKKLADVQQWLQPTDYNSPGNEYMKHLHSHVPGTGAWVRESPTFRAWTQSTSLNGAQTEAQGILHVRGVAGSGKSVFAASTIHQVQKAEPKTLVLFFFFRQIVKKNHSAKYLVRDFASQLLPHSRPLVSKLHGLSRTQGVNGTELGILWDAITHALQNMPAVVCVVDALDEMDDEDFGFVNQLLVLGTGYPGRVKLLLTSRPIPKIEKAFRDSQVLRLKLELSLIYPDVAKYVDVKLVSLNPPLGPETEDLVKQTICERAQGLFLHARLMTDNLIEGLIDERISEEKLPDSLERLPRSLKDVYDEMLKEHARRSGVDKEQQAQVLMCVTNSCRPLRLIELGSLVASLRGVCDLKEGKSLVRASCGRLLEILEDETVSIIHHSFTEFLGDKSRQEITDSFPVLDTQHAHGMMAILSLQYLNGCPLLDMKPGSPGTVEYHKYDVNEEHSMFLELSRRRQVVQDMQLTYPLLDYAVENLAHHIENTRPYDEKVLDAVATLLVPDKPAFGLWMYYKWQSFFCSTFGAVHLATVAGMPLYIIEHMAHLGIDTMDGDGRTPLSYATKNGYIEAVDFFLKQGADPQSSGKDGYTPLHHATLEGNFDIVKLLMKAGANPLIGTNHPNSYCNDGYFPDPCYGETPLELACRSGDADIICSFIPWIPTDGMNRCLHWMKGAKNLEALLRIGHADVNCFAGGKTKLFEASRCHDLEAMQVLLQYGADPKIRCSGIHWESDKTITLEVDNPRGPMAIHAFAGYDAVAGFNSRTQLLNDKCIDNSRLCLQLLLNSGASIEAATDGTDDYSDRDDGNFTALFYAVRKGSDIISERGDIHDHDETEHELASILLEAGADPNARSSRGNTPVHHANSQNADLFNVLLTHSADVNAKNNFGRTPLLKLMRQHDTKPNIEVFEKLLEGGADLNVPDNKGNTILHHIMKHLDKFRSEDLPFLQLVTNSGTDLNKMNNDGLPPSMMYQNDSSWMSRVRDDEPLLQALVDGGMNMNARSSTKKTLLWEYIKCYNAQIEVAEMFIRLGADVMVRADDGTTLLHPAVESRRSIEWIQFLVSKGLDPRVRDTEGNTLVHLAIRAYDGMVNDDGQDLIEVLGELGISAEETDGQGRTALHLASLSPPVQDYARRNDEHWIDVVLKTPTFGIQDVDVRDYSGATALHYAARTSEFNVAKLLRAGADPTILTLEGVSPLHIACRARQPDIIALLLTTYKDQGALEELVNLHDLHGMQRTSLHVAARSGTPESVIYLLASGADVAAIDRNDYTPLHALAEFTLDYELWDTKGVFQDLRTKSIPAYNKTKFEWEAYRGHDANELDTLELLLEAGADVHAKAVFEQSNVTPLDLALKLGCRTVVQGLLRHEVEVQDAPIAQPAKDEESTEGAQALLEIKDPDQLLSKVVEVLKGHEYTTIKEFVRRGGSLMVTNKDRKVSILHEMVELGCTSLLEYFRNEAFEFDQQCQRKTHDQMTLLAKACQRSLPSLHIIKYLIENIGLDVNGRSNRWDQTTPLHIVAYGYHFWHIEAVTYLLSQGADLEARTTNGQTPLLCAISATDPNGYWKEHTIKTLLDHGADPNVTSMFGGTCLKQADGAAVTELLLRYGADLTAVPDIVYCAVKRMDVDMVQVLLDAGADPSCPDRRYVEENEDDTENSESEDIEGSEDIGGNENFEGNKNVEGSAGIEDVHNNEDLEGIEDNKDREGNTEDHEDDTKCGGEGAEDDKGSSEVGEDESRSKKTSLPIRLQSEYPLYSAARPTAPKRRAPEWNTRQYLVTKALLKYGANPYASYADGSYVLQAIVEEHGLLTPFLELENLDIEKRGRNERTLLLSACISTEHLDWRIWQHMGRDRPNGANAEAILALLERGAVPNVVDDQGRTPLHCLCTTTKPYDQIHRNAFKALVALDEAAIHTADNTGFKPLHRALQCNQRWAVRHLLASGADPREADPDGNTALHFLAPQLVREQTIAAQARRDFKRFVHKTGLDINARNKKGETPLFLCVAADWIESTPAFALKNQAPLSDVLHLFVEAGADLFTVDGGGRTLLHAAVGRRAKEEYSNGDQARHRVRVFEALMGLGLDPRREDGLMRTAIDVAVAVGRREIVELFAERR